MSPSTVSSRDSGPVREEWITGPIPPFVVALNRLAKLGKATVYAPGSRRFCKFEIDGTPLAAKWIPLRDAHTVTLIYRDRGLVL